MSWDKRIISFWNHGEKWDTVQTCRSWAMITESLFSEPEVGDIHFYLLLWFTNTNLFPVNFKVQDIIGKSNRNNSLYCTLLFFRRWKNKLSSQIYQGYFQWFLHTNNWGYLQVRSWWDYQRLTMTHNITGKWSVVTMQCAPCRSQTRLAVTSSQPCKDYPYQKAMPS